MADDFFLRYVFINKTLNVADIMSYINRANHPYTHSECQGDTFDHLSTSATATKSCTKKLYKRIFENASIHNEMARREALLMAPSNVI